MKIKLTLKQLLELRDSIINELKSNQKTIIKTNSCNIINKEFYRKTLVDLNFIQQELRKDLVHIKHELININFQEFGNKTIHTHIFELSELKEELKCYQNLNMRKGKVKKNGKIITYSTIISEETANKRINIIKKEIDNIEKKLQEYNNSTVLHLDINIITFKMASKIIN